MSHLALREEEGLDENVFMSDVEEEIKEPNGLPNQPISQVPLAVEPKHEFQERAQNVQKQIVVKQEEQRLNAEPSKDWTQDFDSYQKLRQLQNEDSLAPQMLQNGNG